MYKDKKKWEHADFGKDVWRLRDKLQSPTHCRNQLRKISVGSCAAHNLERCDKSSFLGRAEDLFATALTSSATYECTVFTKGRKISEKTWSRQWPSKIFARTLGQTLYCIMLLPTKNPPFDIVISYRYIAGAQYARSQPNCFSSTLPHRGSLLATHQCRRLRITSHCSLTLHFNALQTRACHDTQLESVALCFLTVSMGKKTFIEYQICPKCR